VVALESKIYIYNFEDLRLIGQQDTANVKLGLVALSPTSTNIVLAFPSPTVGEVRWLTSDAHSPELPKTKLVTDSALEQLALDPSGTRLAVTSGKGTLIRILNLQSGTEVEMTTYRRGTTNATIQCLAFSADSAFLACTSDHGTVHVFHLESTSSSSTYFGMLTGTSEPRAVASHRVPESHSICAFVPSSGDDVGSDRKVLVVLGASGCYYTLEIVKKSDGSFAINDLHNGESRSFLP
jgi:WD40 repeat protein